jgi:hypothetical protein
MAARRARKMGLGSSCATLSSFLRLGGRETLESRRMQLHRRLCAGFVFAAVRRLAAADPPYAGKWKMNLAKSDFGETTVTYEQLPAGEMRATMDGQSYTFRMDGKDYPDPFGIPSRGNPSRQ